MTAFLKIAAFTGLVLCTACTGQQGGWQSAANPRGPGAAPSSNWVYGQAPANAVPGAGGVGPAAAGPGGINAGYYMGADPNNPEPSGGRRR